MKETLLIISTAVFISYVTAIWIEFGVLPSISDSYYKLKHKSLFFLAMVGTGFPITMQSETGMMFFAGAFICLVGVAGAFRQELTGKVHAIGAIGGIALGMCSLWIDYGYWHVPVFFAVVTFCLAFFRIKNHIWWIEILAFVCVLGVLFISNS